jgi:hypothetical protein
MPGMTSCSPVSIDPPRAVGEVAWTTIAHEKRNYPRGPRTMRALALTALLLIAFGSGPGAAAVPGPDPGEAGVRDVENGWSKAFVTGNTAYLDALLDPAYVSVGTKGNARAKAEIISLARGYAKDHPGTVATPLPPTSTISVKGTAAVVTHHGDSDTSVDVFYYADGRWRAWYSQHTAIGSASAP